MKRLKVFLGVVLSMAIIVSGFVTDSFLESYAEVVSELPVTGTEKIVNVGGYYLHMGKKKLDSTDPKYDDYVIYDNGAYNPAHIPIKENNRFIAGFVWSITSADMATVNRGDYFVVDLFDSGIFKPFSSTSGALNYKGDPTLGRYEFFTEDGMTKVKMILDGPAVDEIKAEGKGIDNGTFNFQLQIKKITETFDMVIPGQESGSSTFTIHTEVPANDGYVYIGHASTDKPLVRKTSWESTEGRIGWAIFVNDSQLQSLYENNMIDHKEDLYVEDHISKAMTLNPSISINTRLYVPRVDDDDNLVTTGSYVKMSRDYIAGVKFDPTLIDDVTPDYSTEDYATFKTRFLNAAKVDNKPVYAIYNYSDDSAALNYSTTSSSTLLVYYGDLMGSTKDGTTAWTYDNMQKDGKDVKTLIDNATQEGAKPRITAEQAEYMKRLYCAEGTAFVNAGKVASFYLVFYTVPNYSAEYSNTATVYWGTNQSVTDTSERAYTLVTNDSDSTAGKLFVEKEWDNYVPNDTDYVMVELLKDGTKVADVKLNNENNWKHTFLDVFDVDQYLNQITNSVREVKAYIDGEEYDLSTTETLPDGSAKYTFVNAPGTKQCISIHSEQTEKKHIFTNTVSHKDITVIKEWQDKEDNVVTDTSLLPEKVQVRMIGKINGAVDNTLEQTFDLTKTEGWQKTLEEVRVLTDSGQKIEYEFKEISTIDPYRYDSVSWDEKELVYTLVNKEKKPISDGTEGDDETTTTTTTTTTPDGTGGGDVFEENKTTTTTTTPDGTGGGETKSTTTTTTPSSGGEFFINNLPDPSDPNSPSVIVVLGEDGTPLGTYRKKQMDDGSFEWVDEEGVPLGTMPLVNTGDAPLSNKLFVGSIVLMLAGTFFVMYTRKK